MCPQPVQFFLYRTFFLVNPFFFFKILFNAFFFPQSAEILNFFFFFSASINKPVFFYKCATLKKRYVYNLSPLPTFFLKAKAVSNKLNVFFQNQESAYVNKAPSLRIKERMFSIRKTFLNFKKISLKNLFFFYKLKFLKRRNLFSFFSNFKKKSFVEIESFFSFNFLRILQRVFPFFNFFLLRKLLARGLILLNFKKVTNFFTRLRVGDFISIFFLNDLWSLIEKHMLAQNKHFNKIKKKLFAIINARANKNEKMVSTHYPTSFDKLALFFRKIPTWAEVDFLTFSVFLVKKKSLSSCFFFFNPFLYRLLEFR